MERNILKIQLKSAIKQSCDEFEHIILDGNSTDSSKNILERYTTKVGKK